MAIKYATLINSFVSTEGSNGFMTNYVYYTLLVTHDNGRKEIMEGKLNQVSFLFPYLVTPQDKIEELEETVRELRRDINEIADQKLGYVIDSLYPIPELDRLNETQAEALLEQCGLHARYVNTYPEGTPKNGVVRSFVRGRDNFKTVDLDVIHEIPQVVGLSQNEACRLLREAGFTWTVNTIVNTEGKNDLVDKVSRTDETSLDVQLDVLSSLRDLNGMTRAEAEEEIRRVGCLASVRTEFASQPVGTVINWYPDNDGRIFISVSKGERIIRPNAVYVNAEPMLGSTGDKYQVSVEYDFEKKKFNFTLQYQINAKPKRKLVGATFTAGQAIKSAIADDYPMIEPGVSGALGLEVTQDYIRENLPKTIDLELMTQYGLTKKEESAVIHLQLDW